jgi:hypothetical protein
MSFFAKKQGFTLVYKDKYLVFHSTDCGISITNLIIAIAIELTGIRTLASITTYLC